MQRVSTWKSWTIILGMLAAVLVGTETVRIALDGGPAALAQEEPAAEEPAADPAADAEPEAPPQQNYLEFFFGALGWRYTIGFLIISFTFVAFLVMNLLSLRRDAICPRHLAAAFEAQVNEKKFQEAFDIAKNDDSMLGQMLAAGMQNLQQGYDKALDAMAQVGEDENLKLEHRLSFLSLVGSIAPMVGLLGTVTGMLLAFKQVADTEGSAGAAQLADGIYQALVTTVVGLIIAIPALGVFALLRSRVDQLVAEAAYAALHALNPLKQRRMGTAPPVQQPLPPPAPPRGRQ